MAWDDNVRFQCHLILQETTPLSSRRFQMQQSRIATLSDAMVIYKMINVVPVVIRHHATSK